MRLDKVENLNVEVKKCCYICEHYRNPAKPCEYIDQIYAPTDQLPCEGRDFELWSSLKPVCPVCGGKGYITVLTKRKNVTVRPCPRCAGRKEEV